ncbi:hypothetical protein HY501_01885 [Candidatus Woesearchaeota archaeon]|nr:hypothetical protein [Candidatus Woesearchaeota archaeon]
MAEYQWQAGYLDEDRAVNYMPFTDHECTTKTVYFGMEYEDHDLKFSRTKYITSWQEICRELDNVVRNPEGISCTCMADQVSLHFIYL